MCIENTNLKTYDGNLKYFIVYFMDISFRVTSKEKFLFFLNFLFLFPHYKNKY